MALHSSHAPLEEQTPVNIEVVHVAPDMIMLVGVPLASQLSVVQPLPSSSTSAVFTMETMTPLASQLRSWQSPASWLATAVPGGFGE